MTSSQPTKKPPRDHQHDHQCGHSHGTSHSTSHAHGHHHHHQHHHGLAVGNIRFAFFLNLSFAIIELVGGLMIGSLAIVADAVHDFGDSVSLGVAWILERFANRTKDQRFNFGYRRFSLLSALVSGVVITTGSVFIIIESLRRFSEASPPAGLPMIGLALLGLAVNGFAAWRLSRGETQNEKVLTWHLLEDVMGWAAVLVGGVVIYLTNWAWVDPVLALGLAIFILFNVLKHLKGTVYLFLQGRPVDFDEASFVNQVLAVGGIEKLDHLAIWSLDGEVSVMSARLHIHDLKDPVEIEKVKEKVRAIATSFKARATLETCLAESAEHHDDVSGLRS